jgi:hypothetical protein
LVVKIENNAKCKILGIRLSLYKRIKVKITAANINKLVISTLLLLNGTNNKYTNKTKMIANTMELIMLIILLKI